MTLPGHILDERTAQPVKKTGLIAVSVAGALLFVCCLPILAVHFVEWNARREAAQDIDRAFNELLVPASAFVRAFAEREHRLPTDTEMDEFNRGSSGWGIVTIIRDPQERPGSWGIPGKDFIVRTALPEWTLLLSSWDNKRVEAYTE
ncbi:MAG TPA: hypothetical protein VF593_11860 [Chthoniobacteraceae bacterium]